MNLGDVLTASGLRLSATVSLEEWTALGAQLGAVYRTCPWAIGDWLIAGEDLFGERVAQGIEATGLALHTLQNRASLCRRIRQDVRHPGLHLSHHELVAKLEPDVQRVWLDKAVANDWTRTEMVTEMVTAGVRDPRAARPGWTDGMRAKVRAEIEREVIKWRESSDWLFEDSGEHRAGLNLELETLAQRLVGAVEHAVTGKGD